jgi:hypothetical protein
MSSGWLIPPSSSRCAVSKAALMFAYCIRYFTLGTVSGKFLSIFKPKYTDTVAHRRDPSFGSQDMLLEEDSEGDLWITE